MCNRELGNRLVQTTEGDYEDNTPWWVGARCLMLGEDKYAIQAKLK